MSSVSQTIETYPCSHCKTSVEQYELIYGSYCSERCYYRDKGENVLNKLKSQGPICSNCFGKVRDTTKVKDKYTPGPDHPGHDSGPRLISDATQDPTELTTWGIDDFSKNRYQPLEGTRWSCSCGAVNPNETHDFYQQSPRFPTRKNLKRALEWLAERDDDINEPDGERLLSAFQRYYQDFAYAVGVSVYE